MSRFLNPRYAALEPYVPGEQPGAADVVKLNTNESPYPPAPSVIAAATEEACRLERYCDPECGALRDALAALHGVGRENVYVANGSDDILYFAFMAFAGGGVRAFFPDISYGFYQVFAELNGVEYQKIPLKDDFTIDPRDYEGLGGMIAIANPNAPTGLAMGLSQVEDIVKANPGNVVLIDEAYVDFGGESCVPLTKRYPNLLAVGTFSKSRSMAGARLGFAIADAALIADLERIKYSTNPYNVNRMTQAAGAAAIRENEYYMRNCRRIIATREDTAEKLRARGWEVLPSRTNFLFARRPGADGAAFCAALKERGVLVRHFDALRTRDYLRISVGTPEDMARLLAALDEIAGGDEK